MLSVAYAYRSSTHPTSNPLYTRMIKVIFAAILIAPVHLIQSSLFYSAALFFAFTFYETSANTLQGVCTRTMNEWYKKLTMKILS